MLQHTNFYRPTYASVDLNSIKKNILNVKKHIGQSVDVIAVVKANAYGHGDMEIAETALQAGAGMLAVATPDEAVRLRDNGIESPVLVIGASPPSFAKEASERDITLTVFRNDWIEHIPAIPKKLKVHIKIDSGMGRLGARTESELRKLIQTADQHASLEIDGVFTHFATADEMDDTHYNHQLETFKTMLEQFQERPRCIHAANSAASLVHHDALFDAVRLGISMYGISPSPYVSTQLPFELERAMSIHTEVAHVKQVSKGSTISYGATYTASEDEWIATLPIGYADGLLRGLSGQEVIIQGERVPIIGRICMDQCMVRLNGQVPVGEPVVLIGEQGTEQVAIEEWANKMQTIPYEILCTITNRVPRVYTA